MNNLIPTASAVEGSVTSLNWVLSAAASDAVFDANVTDGYQVLASLGWKAVDADSDEVFAGGLGACVEALTMDGAQGVAGYPAVCHLINANGNDVGSLENCMLTAEEWNNSKLTAKGTPIAGSVNSGIALGLGAAVEDAAEDAAEEAVDDAEDAVEDAFQDDWGEEVEDAAEDIAEDAADSAEDAGEDYAEGAKEDALAAVADAVEEVLPALPAATFQWYQPAMSKSYAGLRRYEAGDKVQVYSLTSIDGELTATPQGDSAVLTGATTLAACFVALGAATLAF